MTTRESRPAWLIVAGREVQVKLRDRNFVLGVLFTLLIMVVGFTLPLFLSPGLSEAHRVAVVDDAGRRIVTAAAADSAGAAPMAKEPESSVTAVTVADDAAAEAAVRSGDVDAALLGGEGRWRLVSMGEAPVLLEVSLADAVRSSTLAANAKRLGTTMAELEKGTDLRAVDLEAPTPEGDGALPREIVSLVGGMVFALFFYFAALMFGMQIANSVVEEKQSRVVEILASKIPVRHLLLGKVVGNTLMAFGQIVLMAGVALLATRFVLGARLPLDVSALATAIAWYVPFFVLGFVALACVWAAAGALASRTEDLQASTMPLTGVLVAVLFAALYADGAARTVLSFVPVASTVVMPRRILEGDYVWWEPVVSLLLVVAFCAVTVVFGGRLYERAVMHTGGSLTWRSAVRLKG